MTRSNLQERMHEVNLWLGVVATRPLRETDYERAHTRPVSWKRAVDGCTYGASYLLRHARRHFESGHRLKGMMQAAPAPMLGAMAVASFPIATCFTQRLDQKRVRSEVATREDTIAFELRNACEVAQILAHADQVQMLHAVHGTSQRDVMVWASTCLAMVSMTVNEVEHDVDRVRNSKLIQHHVRKTRSAVTKIRALYA